MESTIHLKYHENILLSRFWSNLDQFLKGRKISNSKYMFGEILKFRENMNTFKTVFAYIFAKFEYFVNKYTFRISRSRAFK